MSKVSVIIPCYNAAAYIDRCFKALENQTYKDFDVIVVDDCSTDNSIEIIEKYRATSKLTITIMKNDINSGPAASRNKGIRKSTAEYITFCDSDDWYEKDFLLKMYSAINEDGTDISFCGYNVVNESGNIQSRKLAGRKLITDKREALQLNVDSLCMVMIKKKIILNCPWPNIRNGEDMAMIPVLICRANRYSVINESLYNYYTRLNSASNNLNMNVVNSLIESFWFVKDHMGDLYHRECEYIGVNNLLYASLITLFSIQYDRKKAEEILDEFEKNYPQWWKNGNLNRLPKYKQFVLLLVRLRLFRLLRIVSLYRMKRK